MGWGGGGLSRAVLRCLSVNILPVWPVGPIVRIVNFHFLLLGENTIYTRQCISGEDLHVLIRKVPPFLDMDTEATCMFYSALLL